MPVLPLQATVWTECYPLMPLSAHLPKPPQTAAELLEGLLRSHLFAESIFGQIFEQSVPYLARRADEFAEALIQKYVLTRWQAAELLAGRVGFYAGTFRLLERLSTDGPASLFVAEQPSPQRLVFLEVIPCDHSASDFLASQTASVRPDTPSPHVARCLQVQQTRDFQLVAYEFNETRVLSELLRTNSLAPQHQADLIRQFDKVVDRLSDEALDHLGPHRTLVDRHGQLTILTRPIALAAPSLPPLTVPTRTSRQQAARQQFASSLGGMSEIAACGTTAEEMARPLLGAQPWTETGSREWVPGTRRTLNRYLRKGPSLSTIEALGGLQQLFYFFQPDAHNLLGMSEPVPVETTWEESVDDTKWEPDNREIPTTVPQFKSLRRQSRKHSEMLFMILIGIIATGIMSTQWVKLWGIRRAAATSQSPTEPAENFPAPDIHPTGPNKLTSPDTGSLRQHLPQNYRDPAFNQEP